MSKSPTAPGKQITEHFLYLLSKGMENEDATNEEYEAMEKLFDYLMAYHRLRVIRYKNPPHFMRITKPPGASPINE